MLGVFQITDGFRESGFPATSDPAGHHNDCCCATRDGGDQLGEDLRWNPFHGKWRSEELGDLGANDSVVTTNLHVL
jgi:hypothetical protein